MAKPPVSEQVQVNFRMPVDLRDKIKTSAANQGRSMNAEIIHALEFYFDFARLNETTEEISGDKEATFMVADTPEKVEKAVRRLAKSYERDLRNSMLSLLREE